MTRARIEIPHEHLAELCQRRHVRDDFRPESDVDVLIEFEAGHRYTYFTLARMEDELARLLGRTVDLHVRKTLHPFLRDKILEQAEPLYVRA
jgi:predicted nucleotidyltransferase